MTLEQPACQTPPPLLKLEAEARATFIIAQEQGEGAKRQLVQDVKGDVQDVLC